MRYLRIPPLAFALLPSFVFAVEVSGSARISDGDTLVVAGQVIRLYGIDAFENGQKPHGKRATDSLRSLVDDHVRCSGTEYDGYDRLLAICYSDGIDINEVQVARGHALAYRKYSSAYIAVEDRARADGFGAWKGDLVEPWVFRRQRWESVAQEVPDPNCPIKGNLSGGGRIYHTPWSRWYGRTRIDTAKGERWFCDEAEALASGWRAPFR